MGQSSVQVFLPVYLREDLDFSIGKVAIYLALAQVVGVVAQPAMGFLSDKYGRKRVLIPAMAALGLLFLALAGAGSGLRLLLTILAMGAFLYSLHTIFIAAAMDIAGGEIQSTVVSLIYGASFLGTVSPIIAGVIADNYGISSTFLYGGAVTLVATVVLALLKLPKTSTQMQEASGG
jgi:MFS family permease